MSEEAPLGPEGFAAACPVSRETLDRLQRYLDLLLTWQRRINLVGPSTLSDPWRRHLLDSAQLMSLLPTGAQRLVDLGSGAGLPGLVLAIMGVPEVHLVESDQRKAAFMLQVIGTLGLNAKVHIVRIEKAPVIVADVITARALASLAELLPLAIRFATPATRMLFLKGRAAAAELTAAQDGWMMNPTLVPSLSSPEGTIIQLDEVSIGAPGRR